MGYHSEAPLSKMPDKGQQPTSQRKQDTILFADLSGFTAMSANLDPEEVRTRPHFAVLVPTSFANSGSDRIIHSLVPRNLQDSVATLVASPKASTNPCPTEA